MSKMSLIVMAAGESSRFRQDCRVKKHWIRANGKPLWLFVADSLNARYKFAHTIITANADEIAYMRRFCGYEIVCGGNSRQKSLENALMRVHSEFVAISDAARFGLDFSVLDNLFGLDLSEIDCAIPTLGVADTAFLEENGKKRYINRNAIKLVQTPQISRVSALKEAFKLGDFSDESSAINALGGKIACVEGSPKMHKLTHFSDLARIVAHLGDSRESMHFGRESNANSFGANLLNRDSRCDSRESCANLIGYGFDVHRFCKGDEITLCGVKIKCEFGIEAHSDGDVAIHALMDAILGAIGADDIGEWFPPNDSRFRGADSCELLKKVVDFARGVGFEMINADIMILAETPKIMPFKDAMSEKISAILEIPKNRINIKATTAEKLGAIGRKEGICAKAVVSVKEIAFI